MTSITPAQVELIPPAEVEDVELYHPKTWVTKYVFSQDAKVIAIQYSFTVTAQPAWRIGWPLKVSSMA
jgi:cytochrome c oxidase subunit 1